MSIRRLDSGRWKLVISPSIKRKRYGGLINRLVDPLVGRSKPSGLSEDSRTRVAVVPTAIMGRPPALARLSAAAVFGEMKMDSSWRTPDSSCCGDGGRKVPKPTWRVTE